MLKAQIIIDSDAAESYIQVSERIDASRVGLHDGTHGQLLVRTIDGIEVDQLPTLAQRIEELDDKVVEEQAPQPRKYRTEREGDMLRVIATGNGGGWRAGRRGGLIAREGLLSQEGACWVDETSRLEDDFRVRGDVEVTGGSVLSGYGCAEGSGQIYNSKVTDAVVRGEISVSSSTLQRGEYVDYVHIARCTVNLTRASGKLRNVQLRDCLISADAGSSYMFLADLCATNAWIRRSTDAVSMPTRLGSLCAYRMVDDGVVQMRVSAGCQTKRNYDGLRRAAVVHGVNPVEMTILDGFFTMADAAKVTWGIGEEVPDTVTFSFADDETEDDD